MSSTEPLEVRALLATFTVTNLNDSGAGSLRQAITQANVTAGMDTIELQPYLNGTISLTSGTLFIRESVTISGPGADRLAISGGSSTFQVFQADDLNDNSLSDVSISGVTIRDGGDGTTFMNGAGIFSRENLTLTGVALLNNNAGAVGGGGAVQMFAGNLRMQSCTVAGNKARQGGGIELSTAAVSGEIVNCTISGNQAEGFGGGVLALNGTLTIRNSTVTGNRANANGQNQGASGGGVYGNLLGTTPLLTLHNTIVAGNLWGTITDSEPDDIGNPVNSASSNNVIGDALFSGGLSNSTNGNIVGNNGTGTRPIALILNTTLANNGGPTQTHALAANSVAINAGNNSQAIGIDGNPLTTDQRGLFRFLGNVDIGAFETIAVTNPIVVDTSVDENDGNIDPGGVSLREAILLANTAAGANTITFANATNGQPIDLSALGHFEILDTLTINGNGAANTIIDGQRSSGIFLVQSSAGNVTFSGLTLRNGRTVETGGAITFFSDGVLTINQSTLSGNSSSNSSSNSGSISLGGAIFAIGAVTINQSTLSGNSSSIISNSGSLSQGGAIYAIGAVTINQSTLSGNSSSSSRNFNSSDGFSLVQGGAIYASGAVTINQSTLSGNSISSSNSSSVSLGGAIFASGRNVSKTIRNSIVAGNEAVFGADIYVGSGTVTVMNSLIGQRDGTDLTATSGSTPDANGNFIGGSTDATKIDPRLGPLADNGGPTQTHELLTGSLAINRGSNNRAVDITNNNAPLTFDQRGTGFDRIQFGTVDMGAFEFSEIDPLLGTNNDDAFVVTYPNTATGFVTVTVSSGGGPVRSLGSFPTSFALTLNGLAGNDSVRVIGTTGNDTISVVGNAVTINNSKLSLPSIENRTLVAGAGNDLYKFDADTALGAYVLDESAGGIDTIDLSSTSTVGLTVDLGFATQQTVHSTNLRLTLGSTTTFENVIGGSRDDILTGNSQGNTLTGNAGNDTLNGRTGSDILNGGLNDDTYIFAIAPGLEADQVNELTKQGTDTLDFSALSTGFSLNLGTTTVQTVHNNRTLKLNVSNAFENVVGGFGSDTLTGNSLNNSLKGNAGNDTLIGEAGNDTLAGDAGDDILNGAAGNDSLNGGPNDDTYNFTTAAAAEFDQVFEVGIGIDTLSFSTLMTNLDLNLGITDKQSIHTNRTFKLNSSIAFEIVVGGTGADTLTGNALDNQLIGNGGNDSLDGAAGNDILTGDAGNDTLTGRGGNDILAGRLNDDTYIFGTAVATEIDQVIETGIGRDTLDFSAVTAGLNLNLGSTANQFVHTNRTLRLNATDTFENVIGGSGSDTLTGNSLHNSLKGNAGNDTLDGAVGNDTLTGNAGNDTLIGSVGNDTLTGDAGNDTLNGMSGNDTLNGGLNDDVYMFGTALAGEVDEVNELPNQGTDRLDFSGLGTLAPVNLNLGRSDVQGVHVNRSLKLNSGVTFENVIGGGGDDLLIGNGLNNLLDGGDGFDVLLGNSGDDTLNGRAGRDILIGGFGADKMFGGSEDDILVGGWRPADTRMNADDIRRIKSIRSFWSHESIYQHRVETVKVVSGFKPGVDVRDDLDTETLTGESGLDWLLGGSNDFVLIGEGEIVTNL